MFLILDYQYDKYLIILF